MCFDVSVRSFPLTSCTHPLQASQIYLFGGWNDRGDLGDFWVLDTVDHTWSLLCEDTATYAITLSCLCVG